MKLKIEFLKKMNNMLKYNQKRIGSTYLELYPRDKNVIKIYLSRQNTYKVSNTSIVPHEKIGKKSAKKMLRAKK